MQVRQSPSDCTHMDQVYELLPSHAPGQLGFLSNHMPILVPLYWPAGTTLSTSCSPAARSTTRNTSGSKGDQGKYSFPPTTTSDPEW